LFFRSAFYLLIFFQFFIYYNILILYKKIFFIIRDDPFDFYNKVDECNSNHLQIFCLMDGLDRLINGVFLKEE